MLSRATLEHVDHEKCILVVDDHRANRLLLGNRLKDLGFPVQLFAVDGVEALELYQAHHEKISVVITDYKMPNMDGENLFWNLKKFDPNASVILCSGLPEWTVIDPMLDSGLKAFLVKPLEQEKLASALAAALI
jgi:two-component system chemotaxis response regulator CheY